MNIFACASSPVRNLPNTSILGVNIINMKLLTFAVVVNTVNLVLNQLLCGGVHVQLSY